MFNERVSGCRSILCFDVARSATAYSQIAGVIAGFAFLAIIMLLQSRSPRAEGDGSRQGLQNVMVSFVTAFVVSIVASFLAAQVAREEVVGPRAFTMSIMAGLAFSTAILMLLYGMVWLFKTWGLEGTAAVTGRITASVVPALVFLYTAAAGLDSLALQEGHRATGTWLGWTLLLMFVVLVVSVVWAKTSRLDRLARRLSSDAVVRVVAYGALTVAVAAAVATGVIQELGVGFSLHREGIALLMLGLFVALSAYAVAVRAVEQRRGDEFADPTQG